MLSECFLLKHMTFKLDKIWLKREWFEIDDNQILFDCSDMNNPSNATPDFSSI